MLGEGQDLDSLDRLLPHEADGGPPEPEYALPDGSAVLYHVELTNRRGAETPRTGAEGAGE